jgi:hypothetical protein
MIALINTMSESIRPKIGTYARLRHADAITVCVTDVSSISECHCYFFKESQVAYGLPVSALSKD